MNTYTVMTTFQYPRCTWAVVVRANCNGESRFSTHDVRGLQQRNLHKSSFFMLLFYHNVLHLSSAFSNKFQIFHHFFLLYLFFFQFSGANPLFSPLKWMQKLGLSHNYFSVLYIKTKLIIPFLSPEVNLFFVKFEFQLRIRFLLQFFMCVKKFFFQFLKFYIQFRNSFSGISFFRDSLSSPSLSWQRYFSLSTSLSSIMVPFPKS